MLAANSCYTTFPENIALAVIDEVRFVRIVRVISTVAPHLALLALLAPMQQIRQHVLVRYLCRRRAQRMHMALLGVHSDVRLQPEVSSKIAFS